MRTRRARVVFFLLLEISSTQVLAQHHWSFTGEVFGSLSTFGINKRADTYHKHWEDLNSTFKSKWGYGVGIGMEYLLNDTWSLFGKIRYNNWGGHVYAENPKSQYYFEEDINYQSINIPLGGSYTLKQGKQYKYLLKGGVGIDNTFKLTYTGATKYGRGPVIESNVDIRTVYLLLGFEVEYMISNKLIGYLGFEVNNDMLLNPKRNQNFQGFFGQDFVPLNYNLMLLNFGVKL